MKGVLDEIEYNEFIDVYTNKIFDIEQSICKYFVIFEEMFNQKSEKCLWIKQFKEYHNFIELTRNMVVALIERILIYKDKNINIKYRYQDNYDSAVCFVQTVKEISKWKKMKKIQNVKNE